MKNKIITAITLIAMIAAVGTTAIISMNGNALAIKCDPINGNPFAERCGGSSSDWVCTSGVLHNIRTGISVNNGCTG